MAAVITIAITLIAGAALYGYVNGQAAISESGLGVANANNVNFLNERFVVVDMGFNSNTATLYLYNNGNVTLRVDQIILHDVTRMGMYVIFNGAPSSTSGCGNGVTNPPGPAYGSATLSFGQSGTPILRGSTQSIGLTLPSSCDFLTGTTYYVTVVGFYGSTTLYYQCDPVIAQGQQEACTQ